MKKILIFLLLFALLAVPLQAGLSEETQPYTPEQLLQIWYQLIAMMREAEIYPYVELQEGDRGYEVMFLQARLAQLRYYGKAIDPHFGSGTRGAMRLFEQVHKLQVNGVASVEDQKLLFSSKALTNPGTPAGLNPGQTMPPEDDSNWPEWWPGFPGLEKIITPAPAPTATLKPGLEKLPELEKIITPTPAPVVTIFPIQPELEKLPGLEKIITPTPAPVVTLFPLQPGFEIPDLGGTLLDPAKLITDPPVIKPGLELPGFVLPKP